MSSHSKCLPVAGISAAIFILGFKNGNRDFKKIDIVFLMLALAAIPIWLVVDQPILPFRPCVNAFDLRYSNDRPFLLCFSELN